MNKGIIYHGNSIISIEILPDYSQPVVIKRPAKRRSSRRSLRTLENEYEMTRTLDGVEGVRQALDQQSIENQPVLILEYIDGETLRDTIARKTLDLRSKLEIAVDLARILGETHQQNLIHLDLNSKNILIANEPQAVRLIDLGSASHIDRSGQKKVRPDQMLGTLPYISPEQTGRINRAVDERSDLYSLGVVLYELMTRQLPFDSKDSLKLVHDHITRTPVSPSEVSSGIPEVLSAIILKLLSKNAGDRYQSAAGVRADLEKCLQHLSPEDTIEAFPLGEADYASRLRFPQKLYGRDRELKELESAFESVCRDTSSIVFVGGYSGIGKTALVEEIQRPVSEKSGYFIEGKFDQLTTTPYAGITQALAPFVSQILTQTETQLAAWRSQILEAVGPNGRVLTDVVPSLELVIGPQPAVPDLSGQEAQNRFNYVFQCFFSAIARSEHPICFFLDDLQWIDPASLGLLKALFTSPDLAHLLVVGAYRDNEVHDDHPLMTLIADLAKAGANLKRMTLPELSEADVEALISGALRRDPGEIRELARLVYSQTNGNPFFTRQVLGSLEDQGLIALDTAAGRWRWDIDVLKELDVTDNVVELLVGKLKELPADIQEMLKIAACIGNQFDIATLTVVTAGDDEAILDHVQEAVAVGLIWERDNRGFFVHDRVQEAAYALVPIEDRDRTHLTIGRLLLQRPRESDHEQDLYQIVDQLNHGLHLVEDEQERMQLARLNLQAAGAARQAFAFETGLAYAKAGLDLLGETGWDQHYRLTLELEEQAALLAYMAGDIPGMQHHGRRVLESGRDPVDVVRVKKMHMEFLAGSKRLQEALDIGLKALDELGFELPAEPDWELAMARVTAFDERLDRETPDWLAMRPLSDEDPQLAAVFEILTALTPTAFVADPALCPLLVVVYLELCLTNQCLPDSIPFVLAVWACYEGGLLGQPEAAAERCEVAARLAERPAWRGALCRVLEVSGIFVVFWVRHLSETLDLFQRSIRAGRDSGDNEFSAYSVAGWPKHAFYASVELAEFEARSLELRAITDAIQFDTHSRWVNIYVTAARLLRGTSSVHGTVWRGTLFDEERDLPVLLQAGDLIGPLYLYSTKAWLATLFGDHSGVEEQTDLVEPYLAAATGALDAAIVAFVFGLRRARELRELPADPDREGSLREHVDFLERSARHAPMNFAHKLSLVRAEVHRARGEVLQAMQAYEKASQGARENGYLSEAGLAHALAAEFFQDLGLRQAALHNAEQAAQTWRSWGAHALVESLSQRLPDLLGPSDLLWQSSSDAGKVHTTITQPITPIQLDIESIISTSQMLSAETNLEQLLTKMITLVMANSGTEKAVLLLKQDNAWFVQARGDSASEKYDVLLNQPFDPADRETDLIPEAVFNYCRRTEAVLVVGDVKLDDRFAKDRMIQKHNIQSMACIPALSQGQLKAMLYLENRQMADIFTVENVGIIKHLSAQFAVSVENALLYDSLSSKVEELQESEERYQLAVAGSEAGLWDWHIQSDKVYYSDRFQELLGYAPDEFSDTLDEFWNRLHPDDDEAVRLALDQHLEERVVFAIDYRLQTKSGEYRWFHARGQALWDKTGKATRMSGSISDITHRKQLEQELLEHQKELEALVASRTAKLNTALGEATCLNEQLQQEIAERKKTEQALQSQLILFDSLLDTVPDTIEIFDPYTFQYIKWNNACIQVTGYSDEEYGAMDPLAGFFDEADLRRMEAAADQAMREGQTVVAADVIAKDGRRIPMEFTGSLARDGEGNPLYFIAIGRDLTERRQVEEQLRFQAHMLDAVEQAVIVTDMDGRVIYWNPFAERLYGWSAEEATGRTTMGLITSEQARQHLTELMVFLQAGGSWSGEYLARRRDGTLFPIENTLTPIADARGGLTHIVGISADITKRKQAELALQESNQALNQRLDELATLNLIGQTVSTVVDLPNVLDVVVATITRSFDALGTGIVLLNDDHSELTLVSFFDRRFPVSSVTGQSEDVKTDPVGRGMVFPVEDSSLTQELLEAGQSIVIPDAQHDPRLSQAHHILQAGQVGCLMLVPLLAKGNAIGMIGIATDQPEREFTPDEVMLAETVAGQIAGAIKLARLFEQAQQLAITKERSRLARDLHDSVTQALYSINLYANAAHLAQTDNKSAVAVEHIQALRELVNEAMLDMRLLIFELRPPVLEEVGLGAALKARLDAVEGRSSIDVRMEVEGQNQLSSDKQAELYRVGQEALTNVDKHARAKQLTLRLKFVEQGARLEVQDDGIGFDLADAQLSGKLGLQIMRERVQQIGGNLTINSEPSRGTLIRVDV